MKKRKFSLDQLRVKSFVPGSTLTNVDTVKGGRPIRLTEEDCTRLACSADDACPSGLACPSFGVGCPSYAIACDSL